MLEPYIYLERKKHIFKGLALCVDSFSESKCPYVCLSVCASPFLTPFNGHFSPTSHSQMSKPFIFLEFLGKSNIKKWSQVWQLFHLCALFKHIFAPHSQSSMSKLFRFSESLERSNGKKWSQIWKLFLIMGVKLPRKKKLGEVCLTSRIFLVSVLLSAMVQKFFVSCMHFF